MTITKRGVALGKIREEQRTIWEQVKAVIEPAAREERYLNEDEQHIFEAGCARLEGLDAAAAALDAEERADSNISPGDVDGRLRADQLDLHARKIADTDAAAVQQKNANRTRDLERKLEKIVVDKKIRERQIQLDHHRRRAQLADANLKALRRRLES